MIYGFKIGDIVKYISGTWGDVDHNPLWGGRYGFVAGRVCDVEDDGWILVEWDNGHRNGYNDGDLELHGQPLREQSNIKLDESLFEMD